MSENVIGIDLGNRSRTCLAVMDNNLKLLDYSVSLSDDFDNAYELRKYVVSMLKDFISVYDVSKIGFEQINLHVGSHVSKLNNILSLCRIQTTITDNLSDMVDIYSIFVQSWKSKVLGSKTATKDDAVNLVKENYPDVNLELTYGKRVKHTEINHDLCDAICIARFMIQNPSYLDDKHKMNYK